VGKRSEKLSFDRWSFSIVMSALKVVSWAAASRLVMVTLMLAADYMLPDHAATGVHRFKSRDDLQRFAAFTKWDAAWFLSIAERGYPQAPWRQPADTSAAEEGGADIESYEEQTHAFFPFYPWITSLLARRITESSPNWSCSEALVASAVIASNVAFVASAAAFFSLSAQLLQDEQQALWASWAYVINPASLFFSAAYTESTFALFTFLALAVLAKAKAAGRSRCATSACTWGAALLLAGSTACRSNGAFTGMVFGLVKLHWMLKDLNAQSGTVSKVLMMISSLVSTILQCTLIILPSVLFQWYAYRKFCEGALALYLQQHAWCTMTVPSIYTWIQSKYWGVGFLRYYRWQNIPHFIIAAPIVITSILGLQQYWKGCFPIQFKGNLLQYYCLPWPQSSKLKRAHIPSPQCAISNYKSGEDTRELMIHAMILLWAALLSISLLIMHVQVRAAVVNLSDVLFFKLC
jgi:Gpi18-like mannosyltransferase